MSKLICPICKALLEVHGNAYRCADGHSFDIAKQGYINLLCSQSPSQSHHGDDKLMVKARRDFLELGYYENLRSRLVKEVLSAAHDSCTILDAGCGEGWYTEQIARSLNESFKDTCVIGIDISKDAVSHASKRIKSSEVNSEFAVASAFSLPVDNESVDILVSVFAPLALAEFRRVLKKDGTLLLVVPREKHLLELKKAIYDKAYENPPESEELEGFNLMENIHLDNVINLKSNEEIINLFKMTPYYYKTGESDQAKLGTLSSLEVVTQFAILKYSKTTEQL